MLTSADRQGDAARCRDLGVAAYLIKPVKPTELNKAIAAALPMSPMPLALDQNALARVETPIDPASRSLRVLLAEDNLVNQRVVVRLLEKFGHDITVAHDGLQALNILKEESFDLVLMDVQMPEMDGFKTTKAIREREAGTSRRTPIVAMTAHAMKGDRERCLAAGMDDYISKPVDRAELQRVLAWADGLIAGTISEHKSVVVARPPACDRRSALARLGDDEELYMDVVSVFCADAPRMLEEITHAVNTSDSAALQRTAHSLKGAAGYVGGNPAADIALRLEQMGQSGDLALADSAVRELANEIDRLLFELRNHPIAVGI
jgi:CheY-like chemotaxis protein